MDITAKRIEDLSAMVGKCIGGEIILIGDNTSSGVFGLIEFIPTAGGFQFGLRQVTMTGTGSGQYFQVGQEDDLIIAAIQMIDYAERPHPLTQKLIAEGRMKKPEPLGFHFLTEQNVPFFMRRREEKARQLRESLRSEA